MNKKNKIIIFSLFILISLSLSIILLIIKKNKMNVTDKSLSGLAVYVYDEDEDDYIADDEIPTGSYTLNTTSSYCKGNGEIGEYDSTNGTISYTFTSSDQCYLYFDVIPSVLLGGNGFYILSGTNINYGVAELLTKDTVNLAEDDYDNVRFIGANPNNYVCFEDDSNPGNCINYTKGSADNASAGLFRIIGVFNEDTHGVTGKQLVKLITADSLGSMPFDYKQSGVGSSTSSYGSNDWSDSQLMYMLNGFVNTGYNGTTQLHTGYSYSSYNISDGTRNIYQLNNGNSYLSGNGATTLNVPASTTTSGYTASENTNMQTLTTAQASMIATVTWRLGASTSNSTELATDYYNFERGTTTCYGAGKCSTTPRPTIWIGKIGLMYPSDYGYATSGGTQPRDECLARELTYWYSYSDCYTNDWLLYHGARTGTQGTAEYQWTINPTSSYANNVFSIYSVGRVSTGYVAHASRGVRPAFYLESEVYVTGGDGTSGNPYRISTTSSNLDNHSQVNIALNNVYSTGATVYANIYSVNGINSFGLSSSNTIEPTTWLTSDDNGTLSGTTYNLSYTASNAGTYYLWVKDINGNTIVSGYSVTVTISFLELVNYDSEEWDDYCANYFTIGNETGSISIDGSAIIKTGDTIYFEDTDGGAEEYWCQIQFCEDEYCDNYENVGVWEQESYTIDYYDKYYYLIGG